MKPIRLIELFAGIGSQAKALKRLGYDFESYRVVEIDKYAIASYNAVHGTDYKTSDIKDIRGSDLGIRERERYSYLLTYSFPCQDISLAGKKAGFTKGSKTRSGLLWEVERLLDECYPDLPQYLLMENVPQVISKKNKPDFDLWCKKLESLGYKNFYKLLNAKDYGIPQNRKRCFMVSILDQNANYQFPEPMELKLTLMDLLEDKVDEKYYLSDKILASFKAYNDRNEAKGNGFRFKPIPRERAISHSILASTGRQCDTYVYEPERERERERSVARSQHQQAGLTRSTYLMKRTVVKPTDVAATLMSAYRGLVNTEYLNVVEEDRSKASGKD